MAQCSASSGTSSRATVTRAASYSNDAASALLTSERSRDRRSVTSAMARPARSSASSTSSRSARCRARVAPARPAMPSSASRACAGKADSRAKPTTSAASIWPRTLTGRTTQATGGSPSSRSIAMKPVSRTCSTARSTTSRRPAGSSQSPQERWQKQTASGEKMLRMSSRLSERTSAPLSMLAKYCAARTKPLAQDSRSSRLSAAAMREPLRDGTDIEVVEEELLELLLHRQVDERGGEHGPGKRRLRLVREQEVEGALEGGVPGEVHPRSGEGWQEPDALGVADVQVLAEAARHVDAPDLGEAQAGAPAQHRDACRHGCLGALQHVDVGLAEGELDAADGDGQGFAEDAAALVELAAGPQDGQEVHQPGAADAARRLQGLTGPDAV